MPKKIVVSLGDHEKETTQAILDLLNVSLKRLIDVCRDDLKDFRDEGDVTELTLPLYSEKNFQKSVFGLTTVGLHRYDSDHSLQIITKDKGLQEPADFFKNLKKFNAIRQMIDSIKSKDKQAIVETGCFFVTKDLQQLYLLSHGLKVPYPEKTCSFGDHLGRFKDLKKQIKKNQKFSKKTQSELIGVAKRYLFHNIFEENSLWKDIHDAIHKYLPIFGFFCAIAAFLMITFAPQLTLPILICTACSYSGMGTILVSLLEWLKNSWHGLSFSNITKETRNDIIILIITAIIGGLLTFAGTMMPAFKLFESLPGIITQTSTLWPLLVDIWIGIVCLFKGVMRFRMIRDTALFYHNPKNYKRITEHLQVTGDKDVKLSALVAYCKQKNVLETYSHSSWFLHPRRHHRRLAKQISGVIQEKKVANQSSNGLLKGFNEFKTLYQVPNWDTTTQNENSGASESTQQEIRITKIPQEGDIDANNNNIDPTDLLTVLMLDPHLEAKDKVLYARIFFNQEKTIKPTGSFARRILWNLTNTPQENNDYSPQRL